MSDQHSVSTSMSDVPSTTSTTSTVVDGERASVAQPTDLADHSSPNQTQPRAIRELVHSPKEKQQLTEMRQQLTARFSNGKLELPPNTTLPHNLHWRDIYAHYAHLTSLQPTPDPRTTASSSAPPPLPDPQTLPDHLLYRFLKAREGSVAKAVDMLVAALVYRERFGVEDLLRQERCPFKDFQHMLLVEKLHHTDSGGRPIFLNYLGSAPIVKLQQYYPPALSYITEVWDMERALKALEETSAQHGRRITQLSIILDTKDLTLAHRELLHHLQPVLWTDDQLYPECMYQLILGNTPSVLTVLWQIIQVFIDKQTRAKFVFLPPKHDADVRKLIGAEQTPVDWGGSCDKCGGKCAPVRTDWDEGWKRLGRGGAEEVAQWEGGVKAERVEIAARYDHEVKLKVDKQKSDDELEMVTVWWSFVMEAKDIDFSVHFYPATRPPPNSQQLLPTPYTLLAPTRISTTTSTHASAPLLTANSSTQTSSASSGSPYRGCHHFRVRQRGVDEGVCVLKFSNAMSTFSSKAVLVRAGVMRGAGGG